MSLETSFWLCVQIQPLRTLVIFGELKVWFSSNSKPFYLQIDSTMSFSCKFCNAKFAFRTNCNCHQRNLHPDEVGVPRYRCEHCDFTSRDLRTLEQNFGNRRKPLVQCCLYCYIGFDSADRFATHIRDQHGLPSRTSETSRKPTEPAFQGALQVFTLDGTEDDQDLMDFMLNNRDYNNWPYKQRSFECWQKSSVCCVSGPLQRKKRKWQRRTSYRNLC